MTKLLSYTIIFLFGLYSFYLSLTNTLGYYIHPRYFEYSQAGAYICIFVGISGVILTLQSSNLSTLLKEFTNFKNIFPYSLFILILSLGFLIPPQALSSRAASNRASSDALSIMAQEESVFEAFTRSDETYTISDWIGEFYRNPDLSSYTGRKVDIVGFVYRDDSLNENEFFVGRFVIRCCIVDATPIGLAVSSIDSNMFEDNTWVRVVGEFSVEEASGRDTLRVIASSIEEVSQPDSPYIY